MLWTAYKTLFFRECGVMARFWSITLAPPILTTCLYLIIFGEIIGARVGPIDGIDYLRYIAPGLILLWTVPYSFGHSAGGFLGSRIYRYVDELLVSPMPGWLIMTA
jgi:ABC-2 type transport system permease protein